MYIAYLFFVGVFLDPLSSVVEAQVGLAAPLLHLDLCPCIYM